MKVIKICAALLALVLCAPLANAQLYGLNAESPRSHQIEIKFGAYMPGIDSEKGVNAYEVMFEENSIFMSRFEYNYQFWKSFGSLALGVELGYGQVTGSGRELSASTEDSPVTYAGKSSDETQLMIVPMSLSLVYQFDVMATRWNVPLVPFLKAGLDYNIWWITDGVEEVASYTPDGGKKLEGYGDTFGWHVSAGIKLLLDVFAQNMAKTFDNEVGVNNSYLVAEYVYSDINDFGSKKSFQLGDSWLMFGLAFEY